MSDWKDDLTRGLEDMFTTQDMRDNGTITTVNINDIIPFREHTFNVRDDDEMMELVESIKKHGVMVPAIAYYNENGQIELVAGHRRMRASELAGLTTMPVIIKNMDRDTAIITMGETNLQAREKILPSEKAFTYKLMLEARKRQAGRPKKNVSPLATNFSQGRSDEKLAEQVGESKDTIRRYIRLTYLEPELLKLVDEEKMAIRPAVEISYVSSINQQNIYAYYEETIIHDGEKVIAPGVLPSLAQAKRLRKEDAEGNLDEDVIADILDEEKPNQKEKIVLKSDKILKYGKNLTPLEFEKHILKALDFYERYNERIKGMEERL